MKPEIWGKYGWCFFHLVTFGYPENPTETDKENYYAYINSLKNVLPCDKCKQNQKKHLKKYPVTEEALSSRSALVKWGIDLHNIVNYYTGKPMMSYQMAMGELDKIINPQAPSNGSNGMFWTYVGMLLLGLAIVYLIARSA